MASVDDWKDKSIPTTFQQNTASADPAFVKSFDKFTLDNPHPGWDKDPNILNHYGHTEYPKMLYPHGKDSAGTVVNNKDEENELLGTPAALKDDGPTVWEYVTAGYKASNYPPKGYASQSTEEEIKKAVDKENGQGW